MCVAISWDIRQLLVICVQQMHSHTCLIGCIHNYTVTKHWAELTTPLNRHFLVVHYIGLHVAYIYILLLHTGMLPVYVTLWCTNNNMKLLTHLCFPPAYISEKIYTQRLMQEITYGTKYCNTKKGFTINAVGTTYWVVLTHQYYGGQLHIRECPRIYTRSCG